MQLNIKIPKQVGRVQHFSLNTTLNFLAKYLSCWMKIVQHDLRLDYKSLEVVIIGDEKELYADRGYAPSRKMMEET